MDGRGLVPQVDSKLLCETSAVIDREVCTSGSSPGPPSAVTQTSDDPPTDHGSPGPGGGRYTSRYSPETASPGELLCSPGEEDTWRGG